MPVISSNSKFENLTYRVRTWKSPSEQTHSGIDHIFTNTRSSFDFSMLPSFDSGSDHRLTRAKISLNKKLLKLYTHRKVPGRFPSFTTEELESAAESYSWNILKDPMEDYEASSHGYSNAQRFSRSQHPF